MSSSFAHVSSNAFVLTRDHISQLRCASLSRAHSGVADTLEHTLHEIIAYHLAVHAKEETPCTLALWNRLPRILQRSASRNVLSRQALDGENKYLVRIWGQRCAQHVAAFDDWSAISAAVRDSVLCMRESTIRKHGSDALLFMREMEAYFEQCLKDGTGFTSADVDNFVSESIPTEVAGFQDLRLSLRRSIPILVTVNGRGQRIASDHNRLVTIAPRKNGEWETVSELGGLVLCALRYFDAYGPATEQDFRHWMGISAGKSQCALKVCRDSGEIRVVQTVIGQMMLHRRRFTELERLRNGQITIKRRVWFLGRFDPLLVAYKDKDWIAKDGWREWEEIPNWWGGDRSLNPGGSAAVLVDGWIGGSWQWSRPTGGPTTIFVILFHSLGGDEADDLLLEVRKTGMQILSQFCGQDGTVSVRFTSSSNVAPKVSFSARHISETEAIILD
ncbi:hypothetical protein BWQ96_02401 [Gracilariopsis chorda]|uniref:Uncharacterized protein n=1 Tax=Gracilariopsis chorda TaxID=448386 RepID=A0A2V3J045_9FLOR|nr:hypothetical protein BWQ96_02401 [Gracilariopsis chorda]|eukprot:PXF47719.1 hypothetical protein BWQ96_02401 [Gracilariopsis chorda]